MPYNYNVYDTTTDVKVLQQQIEDNYYYIVSNFEGSDAPSGSGVPLNGMLWADTGDRKLKVLSDISWIPIVDFATGEIVITDQQVTSEKISDLARKGSIVEGESIAPSSCAIKAHPVIVSLPTEAEQGATHVFGGSASFVPILSYKAYIPQGVSEIHMRARARGNSGGTSVYMRFAVENNDSNATSLISGTGYQWTNDVYLDVSQTTGWVDLEIQGSTSSAFNYGTMQGFAFRSDDIV